MDAIAVSGKLVFDPAPVSSSLDAARVYVRLEDTTMLDVAAVEVVQQEILLNDQDLSRGQLTFDLPVVHPDPSHSYNVRAHVDMDGDGGISRGDYISVQGYPVLTFGFPTHVRIRLRLVE